MQTIHDKLEQNIQENKDHVQQYLEGQITIIPTKADIEDAIKQHSNIITQNWQSQFNDMIIDLQMLKDINQNIIVSVATHTDGTMSMIRDARNASNITDSVESYKIQQLNQIRGAIMLLEQDAERKTTLLNAELAEWNEKNAKGVSGNDQTKVRAELAKIGTKIKDIENELKELQIKVAFTRDNILLERAKSVINATIIDTKALNTDLVNILDAAGVEDAGKKMEVAKEFSGMTQQQYHVTTLTKAYDAKGKAKVKIESDVAALGLTDDLKAQYQAIKAHKDQSKDLSKDVNLADGKGVTWFNTLPIHEKQMVMSVVDQILQGNTNFPTQLRGILPGIRNAYVKTTSIYDGNTTTEVLKTNHMGTASYHHKKLSETENQAVTDLNVKQMQEVFGGSNIVMNVLNSPANIFDGIDAAIGRRVQKAAETLKAFVKSVVTPFNDFRKVSSNETTAYNDILKNNVATLATKKGYPEIAKYLQKGGSLSKASKELESIETKIKDQKISISNALTAPGKSLMEKELNNMLELQVILRGAMRAKQFMGQSRLFSDPENTNLQISTEMKLLAHRMQNSSDNQIRDQAGFSVVTFCASGKDRTGLAETDASTRAADARLGVSNIRTPDIKAMNLKEQVKGGHTQTMAGMNGGTLGCHGIKKDTKAAFPSKAYAAVKELLTRPSASNNKFEYDEKKVKKEAASHAAKAKKSKEKGGMQHLGA